MFLFIMLLCKICEAVVYVLYSFVRQTDMLSLIIK